MGMNFLGMNRLRRCFLLLCCPLALCCLLTAVPSPALAQPRPKKIILIGWDSPTTALFRRDLAKMRDAPADGTTIWAQARYPKGHPKAGERVAEVKNGTPFRTAFSREMWRREWFTHAIKDLQTVKGVKTPLTQNFLRIDANPGDVDWFDDAGWKEIVDHFRIGAWIAKQGGLKGIVFDAEPYTPPFVPFDYKAQSGAAKHTFAEYSAKARQRGREVISAIGAEFPDAVLLTMFMNSYLADSDIHHGPTVTTPGTDALTALNLHNYGLYPAFINGWLDLLPPQMILVDGDEHGYDYNAEEGFFVAAAKIRGEGQELISPENRAKCRNQVQVSFGIYLDAHDASLRDKNPYVKKNATLDQLQRNVAAGLRASDGYIWLWGEQGRFWPEPGELKEWPSQEVFPQWATKLAGINDALTDARDPDAAQGRREYARYKAAVGAKNLLTNPDFTQGPTATNVASDDWKAVGAPAGWNFWQEDFSKGAFIWDESAKAAKASGVRAGVFLQQIPVTPGATYYVTFRAKTQGKGVPSLAVGWKTPEVKWRHDLASPTIIRPVAEADGWKVYGMTVTAPPVAGFMVFQLGATGQPSEADRMWFDNACVVEMPKSETPNTDR